MGEMIHIKTEGGAIVAPDWEAIAALHVKLRAVADALGSVKKDSTMEGGSYSYDYTSYEAFACKLRKCMSEARLSFAASAVRRDQLPNIPTKYKENTNCAIYVELAFTDIDTGAMRIIHGIGEGQDGGDKGSNKALTAATKRILMRTFLVSDRTDIDSDSEDEPAPPAKPRRQTEPTPAKEPPPQEKYKDTKIFDAPISPAQITDLLAAQKAAGVSDENLVKGLITGYKKNTINELTMDEAAEVIKRLSTAKEKK